MEVIVVLFANLLLLLRLRGRRGVEERKVAVLQYMWS